MPVSEILVRVKTTGKVTAEDALAARRAVYGNDGAIDPHEIEGLFAVDEAGGFPVHGNQRKLWDAGCRFDHPNPDYR